MGGIRAQPGPSGCARPVRTRPCSRVIRNRGRPSFVPPSIAMSGHLATSRIPDHRASGSVPRRFGDNAPVDIQGRGASVAMQYDLVIAVLHIIYRYSRAIRSDAGAMTIYHLERASDNSFRRFELPPAGVGALTTEPRSCLISACTIRLQIGSRQCQGVRSTGVCGAKQSRYRCTSGAGRLFCGRVAWARWAGEQRLGEAEDSSPGCKMRADAPVVAELILLLDKRTLLL